jgi:hypothetical protein
MPRRHSQTLPFVIAAVPALLDLGMRASGYTIPLLSGVLVATTAALLWRAALQIEIVREALSRETLSEDRPDRFLWPGMVVIFASTLALCWIHSIYRAAEQSETRLEEELRKLIEPLAEQLSTLERRLGQLEQQASDQHGRIPDHHDQDGSLDRLQEKTDRLDEKLDRVLQAVEAPTSLPTPMGNTPFSTVARPTAAAVTRSLPTPPAPAATEPRPPTAIPEHEPFD